MTSTMLLGLFVLVGRWEVRWEVRREGKGKLGLGLDWIGL